MTHKVFLLQTERFIIHLEPPILKIRGITLSSEAKLSSSFLALLKFSTKQITVSKEQLIQQQ
jgi:hypothetical protein